LSVPPPELNIGRDRSAFAPAANASQWRFSTDGDRPCGEMQRMMAGTHSSNLYPPPLGRCRGNRAAMACVMPLVTDALLYRSTNTAYESGATFAGFGRIDPRAHA
jgi:hypothetical protein